MVFIYIQQFILQEKPVDMSADISSLPPWKQELLDKKRRQEEEEKKKKAMEEDRLSKMPPWKRDIILRKQQQKNSLVFMSKSEVSPRSDISSNGDISSPRLEDSLNYADESDELSKTVLNHSMNSDIGLDSKPIEEHLIPIQQNPWVRTEMHWKKSKSHKLSGRRDHNDESDINYTDHGSAPNHNVGYETDGHVDRAITSNDLDEDIFTEPEEEVHYGRGFVDRLRQKFSHLSTNDKKRPHSVANVNLSPKHSRSTDSILDEVSKPIPRSISTSDDVDYFVKASIFSPPKARSMENLLSEKTSQNQHTRSEKESQDLRKVSASIPKSVSMGNDVSHQLPTNDVEGVSGISYKSGEGSYGGQKGIKIRSSELYVEELPRANIVSATRTLFEGPGQKEGVFRRSLSQEPMSHISDDQSSGNVLDNQDYIREDSSSNGVQKDALANHIDNSTHHSKLNKPNASAPDFSNHFSSGTSREQSQNALQSVRSTGKVWYSSGTEPQDTSPRNVEYGKLDKNYHVDSRWSEGRSPRAAVTADNQRANLAYQYGSQVQSSSSEHADEPSSIINQKNQRNADLSLTFERSTNDSIYSNSDSSAVKSPNWTKKRQAPDPPNETNTRKHVGFIDLDNGSDYVGLKGNDSSVNKSDRTKLHLDFSGSQNDAQGEDLHVKEAAESSPSYRDLYFSTSTKKESKTGSSSSSSVKLDLAGTQESVVDDDDEHLLKKSSTTDSASTSTTQLSESTDSGIGSDSTENHSHDTGATSAVPGSEKHSRLSASNINTVPAADNKRPTPPNSLPENKKNITVNLQGEGRRATPPSSINIAEANNIKNKENLENGDNKKSKRPAPQGPGMLLIRPASNLVTGGQVTNNQFLQITRYNDVKTGTFEPAKKRSNYGAVGDVPITNIDDMLDDVPVTNIDDMGYSPESSPRNNEIDSDTLRRQAAKKYEFIGAEISLGKSLLARTKTKKVCFLYCNMPVILIYVCLFFVFFCRKKTIGFAQMLSIRHV